MLLLPEGEFEAVLKDFSERGFRVATPIILLVGSEAELVLPGCIPVQSKVMWSLGGMAGCRFHQPIKEELLRMAVANGQGG
jgi:hypothetical protein